MPSSSCPNCGEVYHSDRDRCAVRCVRCGAIVVIGDDSPASAIRITRPQEAKRRHYGEQGSVYTREPAYHTFRAFASRLRTQAKPLLWCLIAFLAVPLSLLVSYVSPFSEFTTVYLAMTLIIVLSVLGGIYGAPLLSSLPPLKLLRSLRIDSLPSGIGVLVIWGLWAIIVCTLTSGGSGRGADAASTAVADHGLWWLALSAFLCLAVPSSVVWSAQGQRQHKVGCLVFVSALVSLLFLEYLFQVATAIPRFFRT